jgi:hypothetical protein
LIAFPSAWSTTEALVEHSPTLEARRTNLVSIRDLVLPHEPLEEKMAGSVLEPHLRRPGKSGEKAVQRHETIRTRVGLGIKPSIGSMVWRRGVGSIGEGAEASNLLPIVEQQSLPPRRCRALSRTTGYLFG